MHHRNPPKGVIFDLGDVLFNWSPDTSTKIPGDMLRKILSSTIWIKYECGFLEQDACYHQISQHFSVPTFEVAEALSQARNSLQPNHALLSFIHDLKLQYQELINVYAMSNVSKEDFAILSTKITDWSIFSQVFISGNAGMRKPDPNFYRHVLQKIELSPEEILFIDDKLENVQAAQALGIGSILFVNNATAVHALRTALYTPVERAFQFLQQHTQRLDSITDTGVSVPDNFAQLLLLDIMQDQYDLNLVNAQWESGRTWNYFKGKPVLAPGDYFPDDLDTTAMALITLRPNTELVTSLLDEMLTYLNPDGTFQTYFDHNRPRTDAVVSANVLTCFYSFKRGHDRGLELTVQLIREQLLYRGYLQGTRYYPSPDCCLFFFGRLLRSSSDDFLQDMLRSVLKERVQERVGESGSTLDIAMRVLVCKWLRVDFGHDCDSLLGMQREDGGWEAGWMYRYGSTGVRIGNRAVTTALALKALES